MTRRARGASSPPHERLSARVPPASLPPEIRRWVEAGPSRGARFTPSGELQLDDGRGRLRRIYATVTAAAAGVG